MFRINDIEFDTLYELIQLRTGIYPTEHQRNDVKRVLQEYLNSVHLNSTADLTDALSQQSAQSPLWQQLMRVITIGETYFFRNMSQFDALCNDILPDLIAERRRTDVKYLRIWSTGCATGEEPYSIAMLLQEMIPDIDEWSITILATDINQYSLAAARAGLYRAWSFRDETPGNLRSRWFTAVPGGYQLSQKIRQMVLFAPLNLITDNYPSFESGTQGMDVIVCRNVTIYFDQDTTRAVIKRFHTSLSDNGWLIVGYSEPLSTIYDSLFTAYNFTNTVVYRKEVAAVELSALLPASVKPVAVQRPNPLPLPIVVPPTASVKGAAPPIEALLQAAKDAADREAWPEALALLEQAEKQNRLHPQLHYLRALIAIHQGDLNNGILSLRRAVYCEPSYALAHFVLADAYQKRKMDKDAFRHLRMAQNSLAKLDPDGPLPLSDDLTAGMLHALIQNRLNELKGEA